MRFKAMALLALPALAVAPRAHAGPPLHGVASAGVSSVEAPRFLSLGAGVVWTPGGWPLLAEVQYDSGRNEVTALSVSAGLRWRIRKASRVSPLLIASAGVVRYTSAPVQATSMPLDDVVPSFRCARRSLLRCYHSGRRASPS